MRFFLPIQLFFTLLVVLQSPIVSMAQNAALQGTVTNQKGLPKSGKSTFTTSIVASAFNIYDIFGMKLQTNMKI
jgi:hypothetical protein